MPTGYPSAGLLLIDSHHINSFFRQNHTGDWGTHCPVCAEELLQALRSGAALNLGAQLQQQLEMLSDLLRSQAMSGGCADADLSGTDRPSVAEADSEGGLIGRASQACLAIVLHEPQAEGSVAAPITSRMLCKVVGATLPHSIAVVPTAPGPRIDSTRTAIDAAKSSSSSIGFCGHVCRHEHAYACKSLGNGFSPSIVAQGQWVLGGNRIHRRS